MLIDTSLLSKCCRYYDDDEEVVADNELQELVNELSADGKQGDFGGLGMVRESIDTHRYLFYINSYNIRSKVEPFLCLHRILSNLFQDPCIKKKLLRGFELDSQEADKSRRLISYLNQIDIKQHSLGRFSL